MSQAVAPRPDAGLRIWLLGGFRASVGGRKIDDAAWRLRKAKSLVKLLALSPRSALHREQVIEALWPDLAADAAANNLRKALHLARRALQPEAAAGPTYLLLQDDLVLLRVPPPGALWIDADAFEGAATSARQTRDPAAYRTALELYTGDLLPEDRYEDWVLRREEELRQTYLALLSELAELEETRGELAAAMATLKQVLARDPIREDAHVRLMRLYASTGQRQLALKQYQQLQDALRHELDVEPDARTMLLHQQIVAGQLSALEHPAVPRPVRPSLLGAEQSRTDPPLGRDAELELLEDALGLLSRGRGGLVVIGGEAGIGKSLLAAEIARRAATRGMMVLWGRAYEQERQLPYGPFVELLEGFARRVTTDALRRLFGGHAPELLRLAPALADVLGDAVPDTPGALDRQRLYAGVRAFLRNLAVGSRVLVVLDDVHAADEASLQLLHYLARTARDAPLLLVTTFRVEEAGAATPLGQLLASLQREQLATRLDLGRLGPRDSELLVARLLGGAPTEQTVVDAIWRLADGNPFYTEQLVCALRESGRLEQREGSWRLRDEAPAAPAALLELIESRLQWLGGAARPVLNLLSVIGRSTSYPLLRAASDVPESELVEAIEQCVGRQLLVEDPTAGYRFTHPLYRTAIYERLGAARRATLHRTVAGALERLGVGAQGDDPDALAHHYARSTEPWLAVPHLVAAGDRAARIHANDTAIRDYRCAVDFVQSYPALVTSPDLASALEEKIGDLHALVGDSGPGVDAYRAAIAGTPPTGVATLARLHRKVASAFLTRFDPASAEPHLAAAEELAAALGDHGEQARVLCTRADSLWQRGQFLEALEAATQSYERAERYGAPGDVAMARKTIAIVRHFRGEWCQGLDVALPCACTAQDDPQLASICEICHCIVQFHLYGDEPFQEIEAYAHGLLDAAGRAGARRAEAFAWCLLGEAHLLRGRFGEAAPCLARCTAIYNELGTRIAALPWQRLAELAVYRGASEAADGYLREGLAIAASSPLAPHAWSRLYATAALDALERGDVDAAIAAVQQAADVGQRRDCPTCGALLYPIATEAYAARAQLAEAEQYAQSAERVAGMWQSTAWRAMAVSARGALASASGRPSEAKHRFLDAATLYERATQPFWQARSLFQAGTAAVADQDPSGARPLLERAAETFGTLGAVRAADRALNELARLE